MVLLRLEMLSEEFCLLIRSSGAGGKGKKRQAGLKDVRRRQGGGEGTDQLLGAHDWCLGHSFTKRLLFIMSQHKKNMLRVKNK